jgi:heat shock protein 4
MEKHEKERAAKQADLERAKREAESKKQAEAPPTENAKDTEMTDAEAQKPESVEEAS